MWILLPQLGKLREDYARSLFFLQELVFKQSHLKMFDIGKSFVMQATMAKLYLASAANFLGKTIFLWKSRSADDVSAKWGLDPG